MGDLSPHFSRKEFECRGCGRLVLDDNLLDGLEALRKLRRTRGCQRRIPLSAAQPGSRGSSKQRAHPRAGGRHSPAWIVPAEDVRTGAGGPPILTGTATSSTSMFATAGRALGPR